MNNRPDSVGFGTPPARPQSIWAGAAEVAPPRVIWPAGPLNGPTSVNGAAAAGDANASVAAAVARRSLVRIGEVLPWCVANPSADRETVPAQRASEPPGKPLVYALDHEDLGAPVRRPARARRGRSRRARPARRRAGGRRAGGDGPPAGAVHRRARPRVRARRRARAARARGGADPAGQRRRRRRAARRRDRRAARHRRRRRRRARSARRRGRDVRGRDPRGRGARLRGLRGDGAREARRRSAPRRRRGTACARSRSSTAWGACRSASRR